MPPLLNGLMSSIWGVGSRSNAAVSDEETSDVASEEVKIPIRKTPPKKAVKQDSQSEESAKGEEVESKNGDEDEIEGEEEEDELGEEIFIVEAIKTHLISDDGVLMFQVKWEGYEKRSDLTWEPEENLRGSADEILDSYLESVGGLEKILNQGNAEAKEKRRGKKRGRASTATETAEKPNGRKSRKSSHPASSTPPASLADVPFKPPTGSWEAEVQGIDACEGTDGQVMVFLSWPGGHKTQHPLDQVYKRCPQKMLKFYESHLSFTPATHISENSTDVLAESSKKGRGRPRKEKAPNEKA